MKKKVLISLLLVLILSVSVALVACHKVDAEVLEDILFELQDTYPKTTTTNESFKRSVEMVHFTDDGKMIEVRIKWTVEGSNLVSVSDVDADNNVTVNIPAVRDSEIKYTLVGTLTNEKGKEFTRKDKTTYTAKFEYTAQKTNVSQNVGTEFRKTIVMNPTPDTDYVWGTYQGHELYYFAGKTGSNTHNYATTKNYSEAVPVRLEAVEGGYLLYFMKDNVKTYLSMTIYDSGSYVSGSTGFVTDKAQAGGPLTIDEATGALKCDTLTYNNNTYKFYFGMRFQYNAEVRVIDAQYLTYDENENHSWKTNETPFYLLSKETTIPEQETLTEAQILEKAFALGANEEMPGVIELTGTITEVVSAYDRYGTVKIQVADKTIECYCLLNRSDLKVSELRVGDKIKVRGVLRNYTKDTTSKVEFDQGCTFTVIERTPDQPITKPEDLVHAGTAADPFSVADADKYAKVLGTKKTEEPVYVKGIVTELKDPSQGEYNFNIVDAAGDTVKCIIYWTTSTQAPADGDTVVVKGYLTQYSGSAEIVKKDNSNKPSIVSINGTDLTGPAPVEVPSNVDRVDAPVADTAYLIAIDQGKNNKQIYLLAQMSSYYVATSADRFQGVKFYVETATDGYKIYRLVDSVKKYLGVEVTVGSDSKTHVNVSLDKDYVWKIDAEGIHTTVGEGDAAKEYYLGTNGIFETVGMYTADQTDLFKAYFGTLKADKVNAVISVDEDENATVTVDKTSAAIGETVTVTVTPKNGYVIVAVEVNGKEIEAVSGVYSFAVATDSVVSVVVRDGSEPEPTTKEIELTTDSMELTKSSYSGAAKSITIDGLALEYIEMGYFTNGLQWRTQNGLTTTLYNTASSGKIVSIKFVPNTRQGETKKTNHLKLSYGETAALGESQLITLTNAEVVINFGADKNYQYFKIEHNNQGAVYIDSIVITVDNGNTPTPSTNEAKIGETEYATLAEAIAAAQANDTIVLQKNVTLNSQIVINKAITLDMNGKTIANTESFRNDDEAIYGFFALIAGGNLTVKGNGQMLAKENDVRTITLWDENAVLTIENGKFVGNVENIYVWKGTVHIKGGEFDLIQLDQEKIAAGGNGYEFTLNLHDSNGKNELAKIIVTGGTFVEYNPSNSESEAPAADFVAEGYVVTSSTVEDKTIYTVAAAQA